MADPRSTNGSPLSDEDALQQLESEFKTLDSALIATIYYDTNDVSTARQTLEILNLETTVDDCDATRCGSAPDASVANSGPEWGDWSETTDPTTMSMASLKVSDYGEERDAASPESEEMAMLMAMFPDMKRCTLQLTLDRCQGDTEKAIDELLNRAFLDADEEAQEMGRGVDGFKEDYAGDKNGRRRKKGKQKTYLSIGATQAAPTAWADSAEAAPCPSKWEKMKQDIAFISDSLHIPAEKVTSVYHANGSKLAPTVAALLETYIDKSSFPSSDSADHLNELHELASVFGKAVKHTYLDALLRLCKDNKEAVFALADILSTYSPPDPVLSQLASPLTSPTSPRPNPFSLSRPRPQEPDSWITIGNTLRPSAPAPSSYLPSTSTSTSHLANQYKTARNIAFDKAAATYRRSRSDRHFGGAAAYYADLGKDYDVKAKDYADRAAEQLVEENSREGYVDLHGVTVAQGVKIAREKVTQWWVRQRENGEGRVVAGVNGGRPLVVVCGMGRHSKDGNPRLLPAVSRMLMREGWKVTVTNGQVVVLGVNKKQSR